MTCGWLMRPECGPIFNSTMDFVEYSCGCTPDLANLAFVAIIGMALGLLLCFQPWGWLGKKVERK
jgi:hypothetical protein